MNQTDKPTGVPEDVKQKIVDKYPISETNWTRKPHQDAALWGYSLALPELTAKEEDIKRLGEAIMCYVEKLKELREENAKLKAEVERLQEQNEWLKNEHLLLSEKIYFLETIPPPPKSK